MNHHKYWDHNHQMPPGRDFEAYHFTGHSPQPAISHSHPFFEIFFFVSGHTRIMAEGLDFQPAKGDVLIYPPGVTHRNIHLDAQAPYERIYLYVTRGFLNSISTANYDIPETMEKMTQDGRYCFHIDENELDGLIPQIDGIIADSDLPRPADKLANRYQFSAFLIRTLSMLTSVDEIPQDNYSKGMSDLIRFLNKHSTEPLSLDDLAGSFHISKYYLLRAFKSYTGISVHQYLMIRRIQASQEMIRHGAKPKDACFQCGFMDYSSYYRAFKARVGISPEQYRQKTLK
ncbi:MAG: helix-turn-helix domain-containing protein [Clostridia bacterium]|nr:helix-turn-helix domain-containing protein [Clostridia bacterium]